MMNTDKLPAGLSALPAAAVRLHAFSEDAPHTALPLPGRSGRLPEALRAVPAAAAHTAAFWPPPFPSAGLQWRRCAPPR